MAMSFITLTTIRKTVIQKILLPYARIATAKQVIIEIIERSYLLTKINN